MFLWLPGEGCGEGIVRESGMHVYTLLYLKYLKWIINKDLLYSTWNSAQCYMTAWMEGEFGGEWILVYVWLSPFTVLSPETITLCCSFAWSCLTLQPHGLQQARFPCPSLSLRVCSHSCQLILKKLKTEKFLNIHLKLTITC